jgi:hypothetical protein
LEIASNKTSMQGYLVGRIEGLKQAFEHHQMVIDFEKAKARNARRARKI